MKNEMNNNRSDDSCWNTIGVWGSGRASCPSLAEMVHCRNCQVFIDAGGDLLNREPPPGYIEEWSEFIGQKKEERKTDELSLIVFRTGGELLAFPSQIFKEIINPRPIHRIPHRSDDVLLGLANIHGELRICFSLKALIGAADQAPAGPAPDTAKMMVIQKDGEPWVFPVDQVLGVFRCEEDKQPNLPVTISKASGTFTRKAVVIEGREAGLLDDELVFYTLQRRLA